MSEHTSEYKCANCANEQCPGPDYIGTACAECTRQDSDECDYCDRGKACPIGHHFEQEE